MTADIAALAERGKQAGARVRSETGLAMIGALAQVADNLRARFAMERDPRLHSRLVIIGSGKMPEAVARTFAESAAAAASALGGDLTADEALACSKSVYDAARASDPDGTDELVLNALAVGTAAQAGCPLVDVDADVSAVGDGELFRVRRLGGLSDAKPGLAGVVRGHDDLVVPVVVDSVSQRGVMLRVDAQAVLDLYTDK